MVSLQQLHHVQITVPPEAEAAAREFYGAVLRLEEIEKPELLRRNGGAWFRLGDAELHVSLEATATTNDASRRHVCFLVADLDATRRGLEAAGIEIIPDRQPIAEWVRFYLRDPGGNRVEIAQRVG